MYLAFFGLAEKPFAITPDPRYLYLSARHADALAHLVYGINEAGGFIQLTGEVGTGKTTTIRSLLARTPKNAEIALILNPSMGPSEFLQTLCEELGLGATDASGNTKELIDLLNRYLLRAHAEGRRIVLIVDEAQNLARDVLEQVRLLTNLETETAKLLQIILIGQPELRALLERPDLRQLAQRITGRYHLDPLARDETAAYIRHRLRVAGATADIFTPSALREAYRISGGVPRVINIICDRALLGAYTEERREVPAELMRRAGAEVFGHRLAPAWMPAAVAALTLLIVGASAALLWRLTPVRTAIAQLHALPARPAAGATVAPTPAGLPASAASAPATAAAAKPATAAAPALSALLAAQRAQTGTDAAFAQLFSIWRASYQPGRLDACTQAATQGLRCLSERGSFAQLRQFNRPAILSLSDEAGMSYQALLTGFEDDTARLQFGTASATVGIAELARYWLGDFVLLWRPPTKDVKDLAAGMRGPQVRNLRERLQRWRGEAAQAAVGDEFDAALMEQVAEFQRSAHLAVDGVAGIETQVALDAALAAPDTPLLRHTAVASAAAQAQHLPGPTEIR